jgi:phage terminase small subunit
MTIPRAPKELQKAGKKFWKQAHEELEFDEIQDLERLKMACRCLDEIANDEEVILAEGRFIKDRFEQVREHPAAKSIRDNKILFCRILRELNIDLAPAETRPPRKY